MGKVFGFIGRHRSLQIISLVLVIILIIAVFVVTRGGIPGAYAVTNGSGHGYIDIDDGLAVGAHTIYLESVMDMGFCVKEAKLLEKAQNYAFRHLHVQIEYRSVNQADLSSFGCEKRSETIIVYLASDIYVTLEGQKENILLEQVLGLPHDIYFDVPADKLKLYR